MVHQPSAHRASIGGALHSGKVGSGGRSHPGASLGAATSAAAASESSVLAALVQLANPIHEANTKRRRDEEVLAMVRSGLLDAGGARRACLERQLLVVHEAVDVGDDRRIRVTSAMP